MKTVGMETLQENGSKEESISDEFIQKLLESEMIDDRRLGRVFLMKKYPNLVKRDHNTYEKGSFVLDWNDIEYKTSIRRKDSAQTGLIVVKEIQFDD